MRTAVSLFAGVGGFDLALERAGVKVVASVEIDKKAQEVLRRHFPASTIFGDIMEVTGEQLIAAGFVPERGIITGGFPCQDLSVAGKRAGLGGARSGLFWQICRLLDETRAQNFILENVPGLLSSNQGADMACVLEALVERGYRIAYRVLDAQHFGVPQRRRRVFIVGCLGEAGKSPEEILAIAEGRDGYLAASQQKRKDVATATARGFREGSFGTFVDANASATLKASGGVLGGGSETLLVHESKDVYPIDDARELEKHQNGTGIGDQGAPAYTLDTRQAPAVVTSSVVRRLTPVECERLQGFPDDWTLGQADSNRYKQMGNAVAVPVAAWVINRMVADD